MFPSLVTSEFAVRFISTIKASGEFREIYIKHLGLLPEFYVAIQLLSILEEIC